MAVHGMRTAIFIVFILFGNKLLVYRTNSVSDYYVYNYAD